jgi:hypothetical protein
MFISSPTDSLQSVGLHGERVTYSYTERAQRRRKVKRNPHEAIKRYPVHITEQYNG